jgi:LysM repeat protein
MKISKVVLVVAALHVLVIGGIFVFEGCSRSQSKAPEMATDESQPGTKPADLAALTPAPANPTTPEMSPLATPVTQVTPSTATAVTPNAFGAAAKTYVVKKGDSLWKIAKAEGVSQVEIAKANNLSKNSLLKIGQKLQIPEVTKAAPTTPAAAAAAIPSSQDALGVTTAAATADAGNVYVVKAGDSLWKIAQNHHVNVSAIKQANNLTVESLKIGQKLKIPAVVASSTPTASGFREPGTYTENGQMVHYVEMGESPAVVAKKYGVKVDELMKVNNITDPKRVQYGQRLVIPVVAAAAPAATTPASTSVAMPTASAAHAASGEPALAAPVVTTGPAVIQ